MMSDFVFPGQVKMLPSTLYQGTVPKDNGYINIHHAQRMKIVTEKKKKSLAVFL